jgi:hypothetical protein
MAKAITKTGKTTAKKRKTSKKKAAEEEQVAVETEPQAEEQNDQVTLTTKETAHIETAEDAEEKRRLEEESTHAKYERIKKGELYLTDLQKLTVAELHDIAKKEGITEYSALKKQDLIFRILKERIRQNGLMYGEGVLEVLPDSCGIHDITICLRQTTFMSHHLKLDALAYVPETSCQDKSGRQRTQRSILPFCGSKQSTMKILTSFRTK